MADGEKDMGLVLEDTPERAALMYQRIRPELRNNVIWVTTAEEAISVLKDYREKLFFVTLDHDLEGKKWVDSRRENCGMEVIRWLEKQNPLDWKECKFIIHSWNIYAAPRMFERLLDKGYNVIYRPFGS